MTTLVGFTMRRILLACVLAFLASGPGRAQEKVLRADILKTDGKDERDVIVEKEGPDGITISGPRVISALEIKDVVYRLPMVLEREDYFTAYGPEIAALRDNRDPEVNLPKAIEEYRKLLAKVKNAKGAEIIARHLEWKIAQNLLALVEHDPEKEDDALKALGEFRKSHARGWQIARCLRALATLQERKGDLAEVQKTYDELAAIPGVSKEIAWDAQVNAVRALIRAGKKDNLGEAETRLARLKTEVPVNSSLAGKIAVFSLQCQVLSGDAGKAKKAVEDLRALMQKETDPTVKALGYNTLADHERNAGNKEAAFWDYLRVHVEFDADRHEHAKALYYLAELALDLKNVRKMSRKFRELLESKDFAGMEFQKRLLREKKDEAK